MFAGSIAFALPVAGVLAPFQFFSVFLKIRLNSLESSLLEERAEEEEPEGLDEQMHYIILTQC